MVDMEVRGVPALQYFGDLVWKPALEEISSGLSRSMDRHAHGVGGDNGST